VSDCNLHAGFYPAGLTRPPVTLHHAQEIRDDEGGVDEPEPTPLELEPDHVVARRQSLFIAYACGDVTPHVGAGGAPKGGR
jgi:hypothetical protein